MSTKWNLIKKLKNKIVFIVLKGWIGDVEAERLHVLYKLGTSDTLNIKQV